MMSLPRRDAVNEVSCVSSVIPAAVIERNTKQKDETQIFSWISQKKSSHKETQLEKVVGGLSENFKAVAATAQ